MKRRLLWVALAACFILRLPGLCWSVISDDEAIYDTMAQAVRAGGVMYQDTVDHKPPGLVYAYAAAQEMAAAVTTPTLDTHARMLAVHTLGAWAATCTALLLYAIARRIWGQEHAWAAAALYGVSTMARCPYDGLAVNGELLMNLPTAAAVWVVLQGATRRTARRWLWDLAAGALMGVAGLFKWQALATGLVFPWLAATAPSAPRGVAQRVRHTSVRAVAWCAGLLLPCLATGWYFARHEAFEAAWQWGLLFNLRYIGDGPTLVYACKRLAFQLVGVVLPSGLLFWSAYRGYRQNLSRPWRHSLTLWVAVACGCVCIGGRFFGHYFLQLDMPLCLLAAGPVGTLWQHAPRRIAAAALLPALSFAALALSPAQTRAIFDAQDPDWQAVGADMARIVSPTQSMFVWGNAPLLYAYADRRAGTRFTFCNYMTGLSPATPSETDPQVTPTSSLAASWPMLLEDLEKRRPMWIVDTSKAHWKGYEKFPMQHYPALESYVSAHYEFAADVAGASMLRRRDGVSK